MRWIEENHRWAQPTILHTSFTCSSIWFFYFCCIHILFQCVSVISSSFRASLFTLLLNRRRRRTREREQEKHSLSVEVLQRLFSILYAFKRYSSARAKNIAHIEIVVWLIALFGSFSLDLPCVLLFFLDWISQTTRYVETHTMFDYVYPIRHTHNRMKYNNELKLFLIFAFITI